MGLIRGVVLSGGAKCPRHISFSAGINILPHNLHNVFLFGKIDFAINRLKVFDTLLILIKVEVSR